MTTNTDPDWLELEDERGKSHKYLISEFLELEDRTYLALIPESSIKLNPPPLVLVRYYLDEDHVEEIADPREYSAVFGNLQEKYGEKSVLG